MSDQRQGGISWTDQTWNPLRGCTRVSEGCRNCYAEKVAHRFGGPGKPYEGLTTKRGRWNGKIRLVPDHLDDPLRWRRPRMVFVNSMSDLFHENVPFEFIAAVFGVMAASPTHTFQVLTKRPERAIEFFAWLQEMYPSVGLDEAHFCAQMALKRSVAPRLIGPVASDEMTRVQVAWPLKNVWLGISAENQDTANERIWRLLQCPAAIHWVSAEPLLGPIDFDQPHCQYCDFRMEEISCDGDVPWCMQCDSEAVYGHWLDPLNDGIAWVVVGGESGPGARECHLDWVRSIIGQCREAGVAVFNKQLGADVRWDGVAGPGQAWPKDFGQGVSDMGDGSWRMQLRHLKGGDPNEWPDDLRVREMPEIGG